MSKTEVLVMKPILELARTKMTFYRAKIRRSTNLLDITAAELEFNKWRDVFASISIVTGIR